MNVEQARVKEPDRIARLPHDKRGYPIPWNVERGVDNAPLFIVNDAAKDLLALRHGICPICGENLGRAAHPEQDLLDRLGVRDAHPYHFHSRCRIRWRSRAARAFYVLVPAGTSIPHGDLVSVLDQVRGHRPSHNSQTQKSDAHRR